MSSHELEFLPNKRRTIKSLLHKFDFTIDEGKKRLNPSRGKTQGEHRRRKVEKSFVTPACTSTKLTPRINGMTAHTHTHTHKGQHQEDGHRLYRSLRLPASYSSYLPKSHSKAFYYCELCSNQSLSLLGIMKHLCCLSVVSVQR